MRDGGSFAGLAFLHQASQCWTFCVSCFVMPAIKLKLLLSLDTAQCPDDHHGSSLINSPSSVKYLDGFLFLMRSV